MIRVLLMLFVICCGLLESEAQTGHYRGQRGIGILGGIGQNSFIGALEGTLYLGRNYGIAATAGYGVASSFGVDENRLFLDGQFVYNIYNRDSKFYLIGKGGLSFSNDETKGGEQFAATNSRVGANLGLRLEQFVSSQFIVIGQATQKFFFDGEKRYGLTIGLNYIF